MRSALRQNSHGGDELLRTANISACCKNKKKPKTYVKERLRGRRRVPVVAGEGWGGDCWRNSRELHQASANPKTTEVRLVRHFVKYDNKKRKRELGCVTYQVPIPLALCVGGATTPGLPESGAAMAGGSAWHCPQGFWRDVQQAQAKACTTEHSSIPALMQVL